MTDPSHPPRSSSAVRRAWFRVLMGNAQMFLSACAIVLLLMTGLSALAIIFASLASALTVTSLAIWRDWPWKRRK